MEFPGSLSSDYRTSSLFADYREKKDVISISRGPGSNSPGLPVTMKHDTSTEIERLGATNLSHLGCRAWAHGRNLAYHASVISLCFGRVDDNRAEHVFWRISYPENFEASHSLKGLSTAGLDEYSYNICLNAWEHQLDHFSLKSSCAKDRVSITLL